MDTMLIRESSVRVGVYAVIGPLWGRFIMVIVIFYKAPIPTVNVDGIEDLYTPSIALDS